MSALILNLTFEAPFVNLIKMIVMGEANSNIDKSVKVDEENNVSELQTNNIQYQR